MFSVNMSINTGHWLPLLLDVAAKSVGIAAAALAACALYWFNPLVWLLAARLGVEAERACDDAVLLAGVPPTEYADSLLAVARSLSMGGAAHRASRRTPMSQRSACTFKVWSRRGPVTSPPTRAR